MKKIRIYSTPTCPHCTHAKDFMKQNSIEFEEKNVAADPTAAREMIEKSGQMGVPVIETCKGIIVGFDPHQIAAAAKECS